MFLYRVGAILHPPISFPISPPPPSLFQRVVSFGTPLNASRYPETIMNILAPPYRHDEFGDLRVSPPPPPPHVHVPSRTDVALHQVSLALTLCALFPLSGFLSDVFEPALWIPVTAAFVMADKHTSAASVCLMRLVGTVLVSRLFVAPCLENSNPYYCW